MKGVETVKMRTEGRGTARALAAMALVALPGVASANMLMLHAQGNPGDRELFFTNLMMADRTPMEAMLGPTSIREIEVFGLYENVAKPDWSVLKLQFECPVAPIPSSPTSRRATGPAVAAPLRWRLAEPSYQFTRDADHVPLPATPWQSVSNPAYRKAGMLACNELLTQSAMQAAGGWQAMDPARLNAGLARQAQYRQGRGHHAESGRWPGGGSRACSAVAGHEFSQPHGNAAGRQHHDADPARCLYPQQNTDAACHPDLAPSDEPTMPAPMLPHQLAAVHRPADRQSDTEADRQTTGTAHGN